MDFAVGQRVQARGLEWDILELEPLGAQLRVRLRCAGGDMHGLEWDLLHPLEAITPVRSALKPDDPASLEQWRLRHTACLLDQVFGPDALVAVEPGRLQIEPYQLVPLMRALELPRPRLLLADDVGLGKTVQAGLIVTELIARRQAHRVLVVAPAGPLLLQWQQELRQRFGLRFTTITDGATLDALRRDIELGGNPFIHHALTIVPIDFAKQERVLQDLERAAWDIAIIDEAHHCIAGGTEREDTLRRKLAEVVASRSDALLLLTATPHDGYDPHFASLIELLDPSLVDGRGVLIGTAYRRHVVRRLKSHLRHPETGAPLFKPRLVMPVRIEVKGEALKPVRDFHQALAELVAPRLRRKKPRDEADALAFVGLLKRSVSTISACVGTLQVVADRYAALSDRPAQLDALRKERARALRAWRRRSMRFGTLDGAEEGEAARLEAEHIAADLQGTSGIAQTLRALIALGKAALTSDPKLIALLHEVQLIRSREPAANLLIYTEYADSQAAAAEALRAAPDIAGDVLTISGKDSEDARTRAAERCAEQDGIILLSTDSLAEGLNLQQRCRHLIHLDLPYNPNRLEQRNGRIDRYGQRHTPEMRYLYLAGTFEERLLLRLIAKYEKARARLESMPRTLGVTAEPQDLQRGLMSGFAEEQAKLFDDTPAAIRTLDQVADDGHVQGYRDLLREIDRAFSGYDLYAVRHGWFAGQGLYTDSASLDAASVALRRGECELGFIDLSAFVRAVIAEETGRPVDPEQVLLPADWTAGLDGLPGFDGGGRILRLAPSRGRACDAEGNPLAFLGRAHPAVRRAISRALAGAGSVGMAQSDCCAALLTFGVELQSAGRIVLRRVVSVLLPEIGEPALITGAANLLRVGIPEPVGSAWHRFARWLPMRQNDAEALAVAEARRLAEQFAAEHGRGCDAEAATLQRWLELRTSEICGPPNAAPADLFGAQPSGPAWRIPGLALDRLAAFALDGSNSAAMRREANGVLELFRRREVDRASRRSLSSPAVRQIGLLMLLPQGGV